MITEGVLNIVFTVLQGLLALLPDIQWNINNELFDTFFEILKMVCYLLPMPTVIAILTLICAFTAFKIIISLIKTIWDLLPLV